MASDSHQTYTEQVAGDHPAESHGESALLSIDPGMVIWTWITFGLMALVLAKVAWKPILKILDDREKTIQDSLNNAEKIKKDLEELATEKEAILNQAKEDGLAIIKKETEKAQKSAHQILAKANEDATKLIEKAKTEIEDETHKVQKQLREQTADLVVAISSKLIKENMDNVKNKELVKNSLESFG